MNWELITIIAQIATGIATFAAAIFLATQLRQQHNDSEREILYTHQGLYQDLWDWVKDPQFADVWHRGNTDYASLDGYEETHYRTWSQLNLNLTATNFRAGHEGLDRGVDSRIKAQLAIRWSQRPGQAAYYEKYGRSHTYDPALRTILDEVFLETQGRVIQS